MDDTDLPPLPATPPGRYRHYKGGEYEVVGAARDSETLAPLGAQAQVADAVDALAALVLRAARPGARRSQARPRSTCASSTPGSGSRTA